jgi:alpha-mannosidase
MINESHINRMLVKLARYEQTLEPYIFTRIGAVDVKRFETDESLYQIPVDDGRYVVTTPGDSWGGERTYCWFKGQVRIPEQYRGQAVYINPVVGGYEALLWVDGAPYGTFATKIVQTGHGNHYCDLLVQQADPDRELDLVIEFYAGHYIIGTQPFETIRKTDFRYTFEGIYLCVKNQDIADFIYDLRTLNQLAEKLDPLSFRRADVINCLTEVHKTVWYAVEDTDENTWRPALARARELMTPVLAAKNAASAASAGIVGHSHMDTAWLWPVKETIKKCARTYSNQLSLMDQFPEYRFIQSSAYHSEMIRRNYPELFRAIQQRVAEGRYEPNGGVWVECDCNITSGESMVRQFLWGQKYTQQHFGYTSNCFWLPDTFGYSAAIPQIMKGCRVDYFLTTKISWNDTNRFPYETFYWTGIDGTSVLTHFNLSHCWVEPRTLIEQVEGRAGSRNYLQNKQVAKQRLISFGFGDGGGGPQFEMIEMAQRLKDLDGCAKVDYVSVGDFMRQLEREVIDPPAYKGELYLELHRGTLTNQHTIKRNNRKAELALHDLEFINVQRAVAQNAPASDQHIRPLLETLLVNQFHDILPGTCIAWAHDVSHQEMAELLARSAELIDGTFDTQADENAVTVLNTLAFERDDLIYLDCPGKVPADPSLQYQTVSDLHGRERLCVSGVRLPALGAVTIELQAAGTSPMLASSPIRLEGSILTTPFARVTFGENGAITSFFDTLAQRELRGSGLPLNSFLLAEDVPAAWDNWDVDADLQLKYQDCTHLVERSVVAQGTLQLRIRSTYRISDRSTLRQDMIFYANTPRVDFETLIDWHDRHRFLKVDFDTTVMSSSARYEIQFGHSQRPTTRNTSIEQAMFEVLNHKYTDLSEPRYGVAILNDCKYGISVEGSDLRLSLHKGGTRPDPRGDEGLHEMVYAFLPHLGGFNAENVVQPAYSLNVPPVVKAGRASIPSFASVDCSNVILETVKACEENQRAFILRLYEAEGSYTHAQLQMGMPVKSAELTNMLEETLETLPADEKLALTFRPFEIKTIKITY